jgi:CRP-like cAMP-binding protein
LEGLSRQERETVLASATQRQLFSHAIVTNQDDPADYVFLLTKGCARHYFVTVDGKKSLLQWLAPGDIFGAAALLLQRSKYLVSTEMVKDGMAVVWDRQSVRRLMAQHPRVQENALMITYDYFTWYVATHSALLCGSASQRLIYVLSTLSLGIGHKVPGGIELTLSNEELANAANVTSFTTSRLLSQWRRSGALIKSRGKLLLRAPQRLLQQPF